MNKRANKNLSLRKSLNLSKETVAHLTSDMLKDVMGGAVPDTKASHCDSRCLCQ